MEDGLAVLEGTYIAKDFRQHLGRLAAVLAYSVRAVGIGTHGDDLAAELVKAMEDIDGGQEPYTAVYAAGIHFQTLPFLG